MPLISEMESSVTAQEQANSLEEVSTAAQQGPQSHLPQDFVDLSGGREKQGASRKYGSSNGYAMAPLLGDYSFYFQFLQLEGRQDE